MIHNRNVMFCVIDVVIGNGTGQHSFNAGQGYQLTALEAGARLLPAQVRKYFRPTRWEAKQVNESYSK